MTDYSYEKLGDERFQQLCQALLVREYPRVQCFPVGQPDGGRDALIYASTSRRDSKEFAVYQIKFVRNPHKMDDPHKWLTQICEEEVPKVKKLIPKGAVTYILVTNVSGTSHLDVGSMDRVQKILDDNFDIPAQCWWRDDLNARMDNAWDLKWAYPELISGVDLLRYISEYSTLGDKGRCTDAIRAFVRTQYEEDEEVRFKQVDLQNKLLELFVDVPVEPPEFANRQQHYVYQGLVTQFGSKDSPRIGAATFLLDALSQSHFSTIVLEGAPGQGKSTLTQFVCQVHRMRLLEEHKQLSSLPGHLQPSSLKIPLKIDLRDFSVWINGLDPFDASEQRTVPAQWEKSLESFMAAQIRHQSGGFDFSVADLHYVAKLSAFLVVLDGFDEVADIPTRKEIVDLVLAGVSRLRNSCAALQVIVTSRPAVFANSPGFPEKQFPHFRLAPLTNPLINDYMEQWLAAKRVRGSQATEVRKTLKTKLSQPHVRDLATNPMQLAILLNLIHMRGASLPDKRTALYDNYVELFFDREVEKSPIVRDHRQLMVELHQFLAWSLHSEAELGREGRIATERLLPLLSGYLESEGHDPSLVSQLFDGVIERVVFLVSRAQGTYEFEVQPLREYFAARFLYDTAPYSPPGAEKKGTKPDRFDAISRNFYWLNVTRFYAGCFSKGELPTLVDRLEVLLAEDGYKSLGHPRILAALLLSDWVFAQNPKVQSEAINIVLDGLGLRYVLNPDSPRRSSDHSLVLPDKCGRDQLIVRCFELLRTHPPIDYAIELMDLLKANSSRLELKSIWRKEIQDISGLETTMWLQYGLYLGVLSDLSVADLDAIVQDDRVLVENLQILFRGGHIKYIESSEARTQKIINEILKGTTSFPLRRNNASSILGAFARIFSPLLYHIAFDHARPTSLKQFVSWIVMDEKGEEATASDIQLLRDCLETIQYCDSLWDKSVLEWRTGLEHWDNLVETTRKKWGTHWPHYRLAAVSSLLKAPKDVSICCTDLLDDSVPLCQRAHHARFESGTSWWQAQFASPRTVEEEMFVTLLFLTWANGTQFKALLRTLDTYLTKLTSDQWSSFADALRLLLISRGRRAELSFSIEKNILPKSLRSLLVLSLRLREDLMLNMYKEHFSDYKGDDSVILQFCHSCALELAEQDPSNWEHVLSILRKIYSSGRGGDETHLYISARDLQNKFPLDIALRVLAEPESYPRDLVIFAEKIWRQDVSSRVIPVANVAKEEEWFEYWDVATQLDGRAFIR